jgi:Asp-tRNA(Asn)/Glu-tRNA(Gln) amidotransferase A subunit family amidase
MALAATPALQAREADDLAEFDATAQAALVRHGQLRPIDLLQAALRRIDRLDPPLHALALRCEERARAQAGAPLPAGPFAGVPLPARTRWIWPARHGAMARA